MAEIQLPEKFIRRLEKNQELNGVVNLVLSSFGEILENKPEFFPEYTDHGIKHIERILESSSRLITDPTFNDILSIEDIG